MLISGPESCRNYELLDSKFRNYENRGQTDCSGAICCDQVEDSGKSRKKLPDWKGPAWYRIGGQAGTQLIEKGTGVRGSCAAHWGGWLSGGHPTPEEGEVSRTVYFDDGEGNDKRNQIDIKVVNCNRRYFVYYLIHAPQCHFTYCTK